MSKKVLTFALALVLAFSVLALSACGAEKEAKPATPSAEATAEGTSELKTLTPGKLTIATGEPAYSPWVEDDKPESGKGFEAALGYAIADKMGFAKEDVVWTRTQFEAAIAPGPKDFDFNLQQYSATPEREQAVDFSTPYYVTKQAVVTSKDNKFANAKTLADLQGAKLGVASGSTSLTIAQKLFKDVAPFNDNDAAVQALQSGQIDGIVADLPTAWYMTSAQIENGKIVGELPDSSEGGDQLAALLPKDSELTDAVSKAIDELKADGTLQKLETEWLLGSGDIVELK